MITTKQLRQIADVWPGKTPAKASYENIGDAKIVKFRDVRDDGSVDWANDSEGWIDTRYTDTKAFVPLESDTILLTNAAHSLEHIGKKMAYVEQLPATSQLCFFVGELTGMRANGEDVLNRWLYLYLQTNEARREIAKAAEGAHLVPRELKRMPIRFPDINIQKAHLEICDSQNAALLAARAELEAARRAKIALLQTLFSRGLPGRHNEFRETKIGRLPAEWKETQFASLIDGKVSNGYSPVCPQDPTGEWILSLGAMTWQGFDSSGIKSAPLHDSKRLQFLLHKNDLLVTRSNTRELVGIATLFPGMEMPCYYPDLIMRFRVNELMLPEFAEQLLRSNFGKQWFSARASGTSGSMVKIKRRDLLQFPVWLPKLDEQIQILELIQSAEAVISAIETKVTALERVKTSLLQNLLTGRLRVAA